jgi:hypothetical protein
MARIFTSGALAAAMIIALGAAAPAPGLRARSAAVTDFKFGLNGVSVLSSSDAWAVGESPTVLHWNGTSWAKVTIPGLPAGSLSAVDALSPTDVWAAGLAPGKVFAVENTLIVHWNGIAWKRVPSPGSFDTNNVIPALSSVSMDSAADGWAVGAVYNKRSNAATVLALHWNGTRWQRVTTSAAVSFTGVASFSPSDATAVGYEQTGSHVSRPAAFHWNGSTWALAADLPVPRGVPASQVAGPFQLSAPSATDIWGAGIGVISTGVTKNLAWHWDGMRWNVTSMSPGGGPRAVAAISPSNVWAVGATVINGFGKFATWSAHWNGTSWTQVPTPQPGVSDDVLLDVAAAGPGNVWAVGHTNDTHLHHTLILHWNGTRWIQM